MLPQISIRAGRFCPSLRSSFYAMAYQRPVSSFSPSSAVAGKPRHSGSWTDGSGILPRI